ncbi:uncharacterized protein LOC120920313 [Rana temporaria]|uniref:uncharacterized protein LOC120920313 n=1 Tax=Rana temporaria TaxID=8407 RepID=UPI001AADFFDE|nr:uncharacterized protein LOC120920313 [Rana temporaria]
MNNIDYEKMCLKILNNKQCYRKITAATVDRFNGEFYELVDSFYNNGSIIKDVWDFIRTQHPRQPTMYSLPKVHKNLQDPPGRPIISGNGSISECVSQVIDQYLRPHVLDLPSYTKDTIHLLQVLEDLTIPPDAILVTIDVESLYNSIPHQLGLEAIKRVLKQRPTTDWKFNHFILTMLDFILQHNTFLFQGSHYLQVQGVAMGTCCAPSYANLYLGEWEREFLLGESASMCAANILVWQRYIDDIFIVWDGLENELQEMLRLMNINSFNLFFTMSYNDKEVSFLDIRIFKELDGALGTSLFRKETAGNTLLHAESFHPEVLKKSIPYSQFLRLRRNCSTDFDFQRESDLLTERLLIRGYTKTSLKKAFNRVRDTNRRSLIFKPKNTSKKEESNTRVIINFSNEHQKIRKTISKFWPILTEDPILKNLITNQPQITFKKAPSLGTLLVKSEYKGINKKDPCKTFGTYPCGTCAQCPVIGRRTTLTLPNGDTFSLKHFANCRTRGVVYLMQCQCGSFYVGKTKQELHKRIEKHMHSMRICNLYLPLGRHIAKHHGYHMPNLNFTVLDRIHIPLRGGDWNKTLLQREMRWIRYLKATTPPGLNESESFRPFLEGFSSGKTD